MKQCNTCYRWKDYSYFHNNKTSPDGLRPTCKGCKKESNKNYFQKHKEEIREKRKDYLREYNAKNNEKLNLDKEKLRNSFPQFNSLKDSTLKELSYFEDLSKTQDGFILVRCAYCGGLFCPTYGRIMDRIKFIRHYPNENLISESRFYCSDFCKKTCPIYNQKKYPKGHKPATSREVQPELRQLVFKRDNYTCQKCDTHKDTLDSGIHCHHIFPLNESPVESADKDNCITLCEDCHKEVHQIPGCKYSELRC